MNITLIGAGRIGSTVALHLAKAGHHVTVIARGARFEALNREGAIVTVDGRRTPVVVASTFDPEAHSELVIVTVLEHQAGALLPALSASRATTVLFMFNSFLGCAPYRQAVGAERFAFGFPNMAAFLVEHRLRYRVDGPGMVTTMSSPELATLFRQAGLPGEVERDMDSFLRSHVAMVIPLFLAARFTWQRDTQLTWSEARRLDAAWTEGFNLVHHLGNVVKPRLLATLLHLPSPLRTGLLWLLSRSTAVRDLGEFGPAETRALIDEMVAAAPGRTPLLQSLRP